MEIDDRQLIFSIPEAQRCLGGLGVTTIYALINRGELAKVNIGRRGFITRQSIEAYVERLAATARPACG